MRGDLFEKEQHDQELSRVMSTATIVDPRGHKVLLPPLHDVQLISQLNRTGGLWPAGSDRPTERLVRLAYQQPWILIPLGQLRST